MFVPPALIAVIGPVEPALLTAWVAHYRSLGIARFHLAFHFPDHVAPDRRRRVLATGRDLGIGPEAISTGPWHEHTNTDLRNALRERAGTGWHLLADSDEFQSYSAPMAELIAAAELSGTGTVGGLMLDRVASDGALAGFDAEQELDTVYPLGGFLTHRLLRGDPRKIVLAHSGVPVASGNHRAEGHRPVNRPPVLVHHFKWRSGVQDDVARRAAYSADGTWRASSPARLSEARRLLDHLRRYDGRIAVDSTDMIFRPVSLVAVPSWWSGEATRLVDAWRPPSPPADQSPSASTISSRSS